MGNDNTAARPSRAQAAEQAAPAPTAQTAPTGDPAATAIAQAARKAEIEQLTRQRDHLKELLGSADELEMLRAEVNALEQAAVRRGVSGTSRWTMSAGVASDLELNGYAVDPANGDAYVRDGKRVKVTSRSGETRTVEMPDVSALAAVATPSPGKE